MHRKAPLWRLAVLRCKRVRGFSDSFSRTGVTKGRRGAEVGNLGPINAACRAPSWYSYGRGMPSRSNSQPRSVSKPES